MDGFSFRLDMRRAEDGDVKNYSWVFGQHRWVDDHDSRKCCKWVDDRRIGILNPKFKFGKLLKPKHQYQMKRWVERSRAQRRLAWVLMFGSPVQRCNLMSWEGMKLRNRKRDFKKLVSPTLLQCTLRILHIVQVVLLKQYVDYQQVFHVLALRKIKLYKSGGCFIKRKSKQTLEDKLNQRQK